MKRNALQYDLPLKILSYKELYGGWTMDKVVTEIGKKGNCASPVPFHGRAHGHEQAHTAACSVDRRLIGEPICSRLIMS